MKGCFEMNKNLTLEEQAILWKDLAKIIITGEQKKLEDWLKENGRYEDYLRGEWNDG